jgi:hypothetical protein
MGDLRTTKVSGALSGSSCLILRKFSVRRMESRLDHTLRASQVVLRSNTTIQNSRPLSLPRSQPSGITTRSTEPRKLCEFRFDVTAPTNILTSTFRNCLQQAIWYLHRAQQPEGGWVAVGVSVSPTPHSSHRRVCRWLGRGTRPANIPGRGVSSYSSTNERMVVGARAGRYEDLLSQSSSCRPLIFIPLVLCYVRVGQEGGGTSRLNCLGGHVRQIPSVSATRSRSSGPSGSPCRDNYPYVICNPRMSCVPPELTFLFCAGWFFGARSDRGDV